VSHPQRLPVSTVVLLSWVIPVVGAETPKGLTEETLPIHTDKGVRHDPVKVKLVRVWQDNRHQSSAAWLKEQYGNPHVLRIAVEGTPYSLLVLDGKVAPLISVSGPWEIWRIEGLQRPFQGVTGLVPKGKKLTLVAPGGDMRQIWELDFSRGLNIHYREEFDGF
jgi:hypothetical protein